MGPGPQPQIAHFACATPLHYVGNFRPQNLAPPWPNPGSAPDTVALTGPARQAFTFEFDVINLEAGTTILTWQWGTWVPPAFTYQIKKQPFIVYFLKLKLLWLRHSFSLEPNKEVKCYSQSKLSSECSSIVNVSVTTDNVNLYHNRNITYQYRFHQWHHQIRGT